MRANSGAIVILTFFASFANRVWAADPQEYEVRQSAGYDCWATRDPGCMDKVLAPDFTWVFGTGIEVDRATFLAAIMNGTTFGPNFFSTDDAVVHFYGPVALLSFVGTTNPPMILTLLTQPPCLKRGQTAKPRLGCLKVGLGPNSSGAVSWQKTTAGASTRYPS
jgi:hypothetical protein